MCNQNLSNFNTYIQHKNLTGLVVGVQQMLMVAGVDRYYQIAR